MKPIRLVVAVLLVLALPGTSRAFEKGWHLGVGAGWSSMSDADPFIGSPSIEDSDSGLEFLVGWRINENFGLRASYVDFGTETISGGTGDRFTLGDRILLIEQDDVVIDRDLSAINLSVMFFHDFNKRVALLGRVGASFWSLDTTAPAGAVTPEIADDDGSGFHAGIGLGINLARHWDLQFEALYYGFDEVDVIRGAAGVCFTF